MTQQEIKNILIPFLNKRGEKYKKFQKIIAKKVRRRQIIYTITGDGLETANVAEVGDYTPPAPVLKTDLQSKLPKRTRAYQSGLACPPKKWGHHLLLQAPPYLFKSPQSPAPDSQ